MDKEPNRSFFEGFAAMINGEMLAYVMLAVISLLIYLLTIIF